MQYSGELDIEAYTSTTAAISFLVAAETTIILLELTLNSTWAALERGYSSGEIGHCETLKES